MASWGTEDTEALLVQAFERAGDDASFLGYALRRFRQRRGMSAEEMATYLWIDTATYRWLCLRPWPQSEADLRLTCRHEHVHYERLGEVLHEEQPERPSSVH
jgi:hypothetical protein